MDHRLPRSFFARDSPLVARDLIGCELRQPAGSEAGVLGGAPAVRAVILEVEAYCQSDPASHTFNGPTPRNRVMFGPAGHLYTYFTYGMHWCANVVTGHPGEGQAVLLRAARLIEGEPLVRRRRGQTVPERDLLRGPARLAQGLGLDRQANGMDLLAPDARLQLHRGAVQPMSVQIGPRVGVRLAADVPWRYHAEDNRYVSSYRRHPKAPAPPVEPDR